jgi:hypothetical protein
MKTVTLNTLFFSIFSTLFLLNGCSSHTETISVSESHLYDTNFGLDHNAKVDMVIEEELLAINMPTEVETPNHTNPEWTTDIKMEPDAFLEEDYVPTEPVITYKYKFDKKFYDKAEWRKASF